MNMKGEVLGNVIAIVILIAVIYFVWLFKLYDPATIQQLTQQQGTGFLESQTQTGSSTFQVMVLDKETGSGVREAIVFVQYLLNDQPTTQSGLTTGDGTCTFLGMQSGEVTVKITKDGYEEQILTETITESSTSRLTVNMVKTSTFLENIIE